MTRRTVNISRLGDRRGKSPASPAFWVRRASMTWRNRPEAGRIIRKSTAPARG